MAALKYVVSRVSNVRPYCGGATAIIMRTSSASDPASIFCMTCARWISTVRWLTPRPLADLLGLAQARPVFRVARQGPLHAVEQLLVPKRLLQEIERAMLHRFDRHRDVAVAGDKDHRNGGAAHVELVLHFEPGHARHVHVEQQAAGLRCVVSR
jgi:hypothetical protein